MRFQGINRRVFQQVRDRIAEVALEGRFNMNRWGVTRDRKSRWFTEPKEPSETTCGTAACIAGWTIRETMQVARESKGWVACGWTDGYPGGNNGFDGIGPVAETAAAMLGLTEDEAGTLFYREHWPDQYMDDYDSVTIEYTGEEDALIAIKLMDEILAGRDPWAA